MKAYVLVLGVDYNLHQVLRLVGEDAPVIVVVDSGTVSIVSDCERTHQMVFSGLGDFLDEQGAKDTRFHDSYPAFVFAAAEAEGTILAMNGAGVTIVRSRSLMMAPAASY